MKTTANILVIEKDKVLLTRSKNKTTWTLPEGKHNKGENDIDCVLRECREEIPNTTVTLGLQLGRFEGITPNSQTPVISVTDYATVSGDIIPGSEIEEVKWFSKKELQTITVSDLTLQILRSIGF
jgi:ADP-ribose pyrophosphatase YjhB (NUDIX family)